MGEEVWREVRRRGEVRNGADGMVKKQLNQKTQRFSKLWKARDENEAQKVTFFFNNIPEECSFDFLRRKFGSVREPTDIFCPRKRDKKGKPFGFVRFEDVEDRDGLLEQLNKLWIGSYKIRVFKPRFEREVKIQGSKGKGFKADAGRKTEKTKVVHAAKRMMGVSFKEVLTGSKEGESGPSDLLQFKTSDEETRWLDGAFTGFIKDEFLWEEINEEINSEIAGKLKVTTMGGNLVLIRSVCDAPTEKVLTEMDEWSEFWFQWKRKWNVVDVFQQRVVWTRWVGIPLHAWNHRFFELATAKFGRVLKIHEKTKEKEKLDVALIQISTGLRSIDQVTECCINGARFTFRIEEIHENPFSSMLGETEFEDSGSDAGWTSGEESMDPAAATIGDQNESGERDDDVSVLQEINVSSHSIHADKFVEETNYEGTLLGGSKMLLNLVGAEGESQSLVKDGQMDCHAFQSPN
ncbi:uncharacterized protein LOC131018474 [Salvia miltiorrhiza]|uniref:uncharacterized protein LOC131018474 n=1 Tax=Salvia miltiorrhiza TaxID=226208 RepID=UPI0025AB87E8|nr:uncharacterized protein LOC131018474 [Salvia miltiorrhiza]